MLTRYHSENHNLLYGDFKFGPLFMRLCYELGLEDFAAATLKDQVYLSSQSGMKGEDGCYRAEKLDFDALALARSSS